MSTALAVRAADRQLTRLTKITRPRLAGVYPRERLFRILDGARERPLIWIAGPPGSGKTTLVASYLDTRRLACLWYQVDKGDADAAAFFYFLGLAAKRTGCASRALPVLDPSQQVDLAFFARRYFRELFSHADPPLFLVFDNCHEIAPTAPLFLILREALSEMPEGLNVVCISREGVPKQMARARANRSIAFVGWNDLRANAREARGVMRLRPGALDEELVARTMQLTQGWIAGLVLFAEHLALDRRADFAAQDESLETVFDYFASELFEALGKSTQAFLLKISFVPTVSPAVAREVTGVQVAPRILAALNRRNCFVERRLKAELVYQLHPLFREFLQTRAQKVLPQRERRRVCLDAGRLLAARGQIEEAVELFQQAQAWRELARLIVANAATLMSHGRAQTLAAWLDLLPQSTIERQPWLLYWLGISRMHLDLAGSHQQLEQAFHGFRARRDRAGTLLSWAGVVDCILYEWGDFTRLDPWIAMLADLVRTPAKFPSRGVELRVTAAMLGALMYRAPQHPQVEEWVERAFAQLRGKDDLGPRLRAGHHLVRYLLWIGDYARARLAADAVRNLAEPRPTDPLAAVAWRMIEAALLLHRAEWEASLRSVQAGLEIAEATGVHQWDSQALAQAVYVSLSRGDFAAARGYLEKMRRRLPQVHRLDRGLYHFLSAWACLLEGAPQIGLKHSDEALPLALAAGTPFPEALSRILRAQLLHATGAERRARRHLALAQEIARGMRSAELEIPARFLRASWALEAGRNQTALAELRRGFARARATDYVNGPLCQDSLMTRLCVEALRAGIEVDYVQALVRKRELIPETPPLEIAHWPWPVKVHCLGRFSLQVGGTQVRSGRKAQARPLELLKALIAHGGREVPESVIEDDLWPDAEADAAHEALAITLHRLRRLIDCEKAIIRREGRLTLDARTCWVDVWTFEHLLDEAAAAFDTERAQRTGVLEEALSQYKGAFLAGDPAASWAVPLRERLKDRFRRQVVALGEHWERAGELERAARCYGDGLAVDDLAEAFYRGLMRCHLRAGHRSEALQVYERCRETLAARLGIEPDRATDALLAEIRGR